MSADAKEVAALEAGYRRRLATLRSVSTKYGKWPLIGGLVGGGALLVAAIFGPSVADDLGEGFGRGVRRGISIGGWGGSPVSEGAALAAQLSRTPGFAGSGSVFLESGEVVWEVSWLRGHAVPELPTTVEGHSVKLVIVDALPIAQRQVKGWR